MRRALDLCRLGRQACGVVGDKAAAVDGVATSPRPAPIVEIAPQRALLAVTNDRVMVELDAGKSAASVRLPRGDGGVIVGQRQIAVFEQGMHDQQVMRLIAGDHVGPIVEQPAPRDPDRVRRGEQPPQHGDGGKRRRESAPTVMVQASPNEARASAAVAMVRPASRAIATNASTSSPLLLAPLPSGK